MRGFLMLTAALVVLAGCGGASTKLHAASFSGDLKFANCMRTHGVPNFPDPSSTGELNLGATGIDPQSPSFQAAQKTCSKFQPAGPGFPKMSEAQRQRALRFAQCMRAHGELNFPDPAFSPPKGSTSVLALRGMFFAFGPGQGIEPQSPAFQKAVRGCGVSPP